MIHLLFLVLTLGLVILGQKLLLIALNKLQDWTLRRSLQLLALIIPISVLALFALTMLPVIFAPESDHSALDEGLIAVLGLFLVSLPVGVSLVFNLVRLIWLFGRSLGRTWKAPEGLLELVKPAGKNFEVRLSLSAGSFAYNLPPLWPGSKAIIIISTGMLEQLNQEELQAVLWHEAAHLARRDFWFIWLSSWWANAFFYMPLVSRFFRMLQQEQELASDDRVARQGGPSMALALADALLKVWEETVDKADQITGKRPLNLHNFKAPQLIAENEMCLTEQRVNRLIEFGSMEGTKAISGLPGVWLKVGVLNTASMGLWAIGLVVIHLFMLPLGCAISFSLV